MDYSKQRQSARPKREKPLPSSQVYELVRERAEMTDGSMWCEIGDHAMGPEEGQMCHTIPRSRGGVTSVDNVRLGCHVHHFEVDHGLRVRT